MRLIVLLALTIAACAPRRAPAPTSAARGGGVVMKFRRAGGGITGALLHSGRVRNILFSRVPAR